MNQKGNQTARKLLTSFVIASTIAISVPIATYALVELQEGNLSQFWLVVALALFVTVSKKVIKRLTPNWPKWVN